MNPSAGLRIDTSFFIKTKILRIFQISAKMTATVNSSDLAALEALLGEFFANATSNERKREIEQILNHFGQQTNAWHQCLGFLAANKDNHFVSMFVLNTLETIIKRRWIGMLGNEKVRKIVKLEFSDNNFINFSG